jgi:acid phosphatase (class A)
VCRTRYGLNRAWTQRRCGVSYCQTLAAILAIMLLFASAFACAAAQGCPSVEPTLALEVLLPPACDACDETRGELAELLTLQQARTSQQVEHAELDYERSIHRFLDGVGVVIKEDQLGAATQFFECVTKTVSEAVGRGKQKFNRTRPYVLSPELHVLKEVRPDDSSSYPSGHAAYGMAVGLLLAGMVPDMRDEFYNLFKTTDLAV